MYKNSQTVKRFSKNKLGRDFVVGDIHGAYDSVKVGMRKVGFDQKVDRLFSVGDLIDRHPNSHRVLEFLDQPYVHAIRGNHDDDFASIDIKSIRFFGKNNYNGMEWVQTVSDERLEKILISLRKLPIAMEIEAERGMIGLVHGDVPRGMDWKTFIERIESGHKKTIEIALTGRDRIESNDKSGVNGVGRVFVGHTIQFGGARQFGNVFGIDTGAVFRELSAAEGIENGRGSLTMANINCCTQALIYQSSKIEPVVTHQDSVEGPFSRYLELREVGV